MYDCSTDSYEENVRKVAELAKIAHCFGATVEAELGHVGITRRQEAGRRKCRKHTIQTRPRQRIL